MKKRGRVFCCLGALFLMGGTPLTANDQAEREKVRVERARRSLLARVDASYSALISRGPNRPSAPGVTLYEQAKLVGVTREQYDGDGDAVAISGDTAIVSGDGDAYIFVRAGSTWTLQTTLTPGDNSYGAFAWSVAIDGDTAIVGAWLADGVRYGTGAAYVFVRIGASWIQQAKLYASDGELGDSFGFLVAVRGNTALIGAPYDDDDRGSAFVFIRTGTSWSQQAKLVAADRTTDDELTWPHGLSLDDDVAALGAYGKKAAYIFTRSGTTWSQQAKLLPTGSSIGFGWNLSVRGNRVVFNSGQVYDRINGTWTPQAPFAERKDSVAYDGTRIVAGSDVGEGKVSGSGVAYVYILSGGYWVEEAKLIASDGAYLDTFGDAVGISGNLVIVGAPRNDGTKGSAYVFQLTGGSGSTPLRLVAVTPCRVADTRAGQGKAGSFGPPTMNGGQAREFPIPSSACGIPTNARAYSLNVTVVPAGPLSYLTVWPTGVPQPLVSTLNSFDGRIVANAAIVPAGTNGAINVYVTDRTDVILDINGYFAP